ncbi:hypothetical protein [Legionella pneumophila]|uniref:hypothetical protein n=1 Tax=Legionella pneumophila TaxID=446 RepID=UPI00224415EE|nr:hypothetical protein [Legionella pneumophila]MCW8405375.1 hypothetical protein [Legionella pneumophila]
MPFKKFMTDKLTLIQNGKLFKENILGNVQGNTIFTMDKTIPFQKGDLILRELPSGLQESYIIDNPEFFNADKMSHFKIQVHKTDQSPDTKAHILQTITISGGENFINSPGSMIIKNTELFNNLKIKVANEIESEKDKVIIMHLIDQLSESKTRDEYKFYYDDLLQKAANYMTIIAPFLPQLSSVLMG